MHTIFCNQHYSSTDRTPADQNARLATHIALYLRATQENDGRWRGANIAHELRYTCQALEALHLLNFQAFHPRIDTGLHWLINLGEQLTKDSDDWSTVRLHPSRFKTLARLGDFSDEQVLADFDELCEHINSRGLLNGVMQDQIRGSIVVADCLLDLAAQGPINQEWQAVLDSILPAVQHELHLWAANPAQRDRDRLINTVGEASYAADVLLRSGYLEPGGAAAAAIHTAMLGEIERHEPSAPLPKDTVYSAIQLAAHFGAAAATQAGLERFFRAMRVRYDRNQMQREERNADVQPLMLRALLTYSGETLRDHMVGYMLDSAFEAVSQTETQAAAERNRQFEQLVRKRTKILIRDVVELSGGISAARVFRVNYAVDANGLADMPESSRARFEVHSVVIKSGTRADLQQSVDRFQQLRADIQPYFAQHSRHPEMLEASPYAPAYLILEDLTEEYVTLRQIFGNLDRHKLSANDRNILAKVTDTVASSLFDIYRRTQRRESDVVGIQVSRLYLSRFDRALLEMCKPEKYPRLKEFFRGFWFGATHYGSIESYQARLYRHLDRLRPPLLMLMHGDCHGRNIMLDECYEQIKLIDLDKIDYAGDYVMDLALLIEDAALFRRLFDESYHYYLRPEQIELPTAGVQINYSPFVSEASTQFQHLLCARLDAFAREIGDEGYRARLWLAIAIYLLRMVEKAGEIRTGAVLYVEAVRLLHVLVEHLDTGKPLPAIPITRAAAPAPAAVQTQLPPGSELEQFHDLILTCAQECAVPLRASLRMDGKSVRYFIEGESEPCAMLDGRRQPPSVLLRYPAEQLADQHGYIQTIRETGVFHTVLRAPEPYDLQIVRELLLNALRPHV